MSEEGVWEDLKRMQGEGLKKLLTALRELVFPKSGRAARRRVERLALGGFGSSAYRWAERDATTFAALDLAGTTIGNLSYGYYTKNKSKEKLTEDLEDLLRNPNEEEGHFEFLYGMTQDYFKGNVYLLKVRVGGRVASLFRLPVEEVRVEREARTMRKLYSYGRERYTSEEVLHIPSRYGYDGLVGQSIFKVCAGVFAKSVEIDQYVNNIFQNGIGSRLVIDISKNNPNASQEFIDNLKEEYRRKYSGIENAGKPLIKSGKLEYSVLSSELKDNRAHQLVENRDFQEREVAKLFGLPVPLLKGDTQGRLEEVYMAYIEAGIRPIASVFEEAFSKLLPLEVREEIKFEFDYNGHLKTSLTNRINAYQTQLQSGILTINEVRAMENRPPVEAGDTPFVVSALMPLNKETVEAYMAKSKIAIAEAKAAAEELDEHFPGGDDKV
jgi:HK97 family phage portal protein